MLVERTALGVSGKLVFAVQARRTVFDKGVLALLSPP
jgi:hypothetical protein